MKVNLPTPILLEGAGHGATVAAGKSPKPILECVALRADRSTGVSLEATDLDVGLRYHLRGASVLEEGSLVVPATRFLSIAREVGEEEATLVEREGSLVVDTGRSHFRIRGEDVKDFAELPFFPEKDVITLPAEPLKAMIRRTIFATAKEAGRFALHGVLFRVADDQLELVATDGRRLARATRTLDKRVPREVRVIVGPKGLSLVERLGGDGEISLAVQERQVLFRLGDALVVSRLIDGTFPSYEDVIPKPSSKAFHVGVSEFTAALRRAALLTTRDALSVQLDVGKGVLTIRSRAQDVGEAKVEVEIEYDGPPERIGFNPSFLQDALKVMDPAGRVRFEFTSGKAPAKMTDGDEYAYVVMPIALE
jgi:DNA polymerase-3 subunit beta